MSWPAVLNFLNLKHYSPLIMRLEPTTLKFQTGNCWLFKKEDISEYIPVFRLVSFWGFKFEFFKFVWVLVWFGLACTRSHGFVPVVHAGFKRETSYIVVGGLVA